MILDLYAGAGGWDEGIRVAGHGPVVGLEIWPDACRTAATAGHPRVCCDVASYPTAPFAGRVTGLVVSPPCQAWSAAGQRRGELDRARVHTLIDAYAVGSNDWRELGPWEDDRSHHAAQPVRWIRDLRPEWVALEQVPAVLPLWQHIGRILTGWGYHVWAGLLCAADYGVPQTRTRAILVASRARRVAPPAPTHYDARRGTALLGTPWVSMAAALGWGTDQRPAPTVTGGGTGSGGGVEVFAGAYARAVVSTGTNSEHGGGIQVPYTRGVNEPSPVVTCRADRWTLHTNRDQRTDGSRQTIDPFERPAPALTAKSGGQWTVDRPATTVQADPRVSAPGHCDRSGGERQHIDSVKVAVVEAAILQGFRPDYPWQGTRTAQYTQVGNAVPPPLAEAIVRAAAGTSRGGA